MRFQIEPFTEREIDRLNATAEYGDQFATPILLARLMATVNDLDDKLNKATAQTDRVHKEIWATAFNPTDSNVRRCYNLLRDIMPGMPANARG